MADVVIRFFVQHPVACAQYSRVLVGEGDFQTNSSQGPFQIGVFDGDLGPLEPILIMARRQSPSMRPLVVARECGPAECLRLLFQGIWGLVTYDRYEQDLPPAVRQVAEGRLWFPAPVIAEWMRLDVVDRGSKLSSELQLTQREQEVFDLVLKHLSNKDIATILRVSESTVKFHISNLFGKLHVASRQELSSRCLCPA
jgi:DNA-binding NarL/FixJ family response regulator